MADSFKQTTADPGAAVKDAVRASELRSQAVLEALPIGLAMLDPQSRLIYSNRRYTELRGIPSDLAAWVKAIHPEDRERVFNSRAEALARGEPWADTYRFYAQILLQEYSDRLDDQAGAMLRRMVEATQRQDRLIQDVLAYHSYVREEFPLTPVDMDNLVHHILETYPQYRPPGAHIEVRRPLGWALAHETLLTQCVSVLLNNAVKFVAHGVTPEIAVWTEQSPSAVKLWIQDNGIGIAPEYHTKIFDIFETLHPSAMFPGTGIGLPLAKKAMEKMQGTIGVESEVGKGARFWLALKPVPRD